MPSGLGLEQRFDLATRAGFDGIMFGVADEPAVDVRAQRISGGIVEFGSGATCYFEQPPFGGTRFFHRTRYGRTRSS